MNKYEWHPWYAWYPVKVSDDCCVWWKKVMRKIELKTIFMSHKFGWIIEIMRKQYIYKEHFKCYECEKVIDLYDKFAVHMLRLIELGEPVRIKTTATSSSASYPNGLYFELCGDCAQKVKYENECFRLPMNSIYAKISNRIDPGSI